ncbi:hypothetical protein [Pseudomonas sp. 5P_3.1_Bac2]|uniref:hypothetical protein n=1 Tax=Pseudomonas sp. 5P_3.1_Bac2 TaxID=2971617 RepID=UPI0021C84763|nr:hypothetical protein [Pseudomonas sp. 5P_3.1_Bac2]MCU1717699.1 hypothetical protein [Pseudomonas sp. 5P_3.1_Bac2]
MHVDRNDALIQPRKRTNQTNRWITSVVMGACISSALIYLALHSTGKNNPNAIEQQLNYQRAEQDRRFAEAVKSEPQQPPIAVIDQTRRPNAPEPTIARDIQPFPTTNDVSDKKPRQTEFNDHNYVPRGAANVVASTPAYSQKMQQPEKKQGMTVVIIEQEKRLKDFCPFKEGSLEQRNCRMRSDLISRNKN